MPPAAPTPPTNPTPPQIPPQPTNQAPKKSNKKWLIGCGIVLFILIVLPIILTNVILKSTQNKTQNAMQNTRANSVGTLFKSELANLRLELENYYIENNTYAGLSLDGSVFSQNGSELISEATADNYLLYAQIPNSDRYLCVDKNTSMPIELEQSPVNFSCQ